MPRSRGRTRRRSAGGSGWWRRDRRGAPRGGAWPASGRRPRSIHSGFEPKGAETKVPCPPPPRGRFRHPARRASRWPAAGPPLPRCARANRASARCACRCVARPTLAGGRGGGGKVQACRSLRYVSSLISAEAHSTVGGGLRVYRVLYGCTALGRTRSSVVQASTEAFENCATPADLTEITVNSAS